MRTHSFCIILATILISFVTVSCGKKVTNIYNPASDNNNPSHISGGNGAGGSTTDPNPNPVGGSSDGNGGDVISESESFKTELFADEDAFKDFVGNNLDKFLSTYYSTIQPHTMFDNFVRELDKTLKFNCIEDILHINLHRPGLIYKGFTSEIGYSFHPKHFISSINDYTKNPSLYIQIAQNLHLLEKNMTVINDSHEFVKRRQINYDSNFCSRLFRNALQGIRFELNDNSSCQINKEHQPIAKHATFFVSNNKPTICISTQELTERLIGKEAEQILALIAHEISHYVGFDEIDAIKIQKFVLDNISKTANHNSESIKASLEFKKISERILKDLVAYLKKLSHYDTMSMYIHKMDQITDTFSPLPYKEFSKDISQNGSEILGQLEVYAPYLTHSLQRQSFTIVDYRSESITLTINTGQAFAQTIPGLISDARTKHTLAFEKREYANPNENFAFAPIEAFTEYKNYLIQIAAYIPLVITNDLAKNMVYEFTRFTKPIISENTLRLYMKNAPENQNINDFDFDRIKQPKTPSQPPSQSQSL